MARKASSDRRIGLRTQTIHGRRVAFRTGGEGPAVLLIHGITNSSATWEPVANRLSAAHRVLAPDMPGHGDSQRHHGDHSLGASASVLRDLLFALDIERATIVGHSLGGGVAMQFAYQFPESVERLVLVSSGGLGREVNAAIRAATLPFAERVLGLGTSPPVKLAGRAVGSALGRVGLGPKGDTARMLEGVGSLSDGERRQAFVRAARSVISPRGQRVTANDRLYLTAEVPTLLVWGEHDRVIPADHGRTAHAAMPGSRLELFPDAGHFPQLDEPDRFADVLADFIATTEPASYARDALRDRMLSHRPPGETSIP
jgi:pimeloyl-ACP methyl ester carboxylesterase